MWMMSRVYPILNNGILKIYLYFLTRSTYTNVYEVVKMNVLRNDILSQKLWDKRKESKKTQISYRTTWIPDMMLPTERYEVSFHGSLSKR